MCDEWQLRETVINKERYAGSVTLKSCRSFLSLSCWISLIKGESWVPVCMQKRFDDDSLGITGVA